MQRYDFYCEVGFWAKRRKGKSKSIDLILYFYWMNSKLSFVVLAGISVFLMSCIYDPPRKEYNDITIINHTSDSLYYFIHGYRSESDHTHNFAYDSIAAHDTATNRYAIAYNINEQKILPYETLRPTTLHSWKAKANEAGGLTVLFYKRNIQRFAENAHLSDTDIFRRIDLTIEQLDSLKYTIVLK